MVKLLMIFPLAVAVKTAALVFLPGMMTLSIFRKHSFHNIPAYILLCCIFSVSVYVLLFPWLRLVRFSFSGVLYVLWAVSLVVFLARQLPVRSVRFSAADATGLGVAAVILLLLLPLYFQQIVPAGADMAMHTYIARIIYDNNTFPLSYEPLVPVSTFGRYPYGFGVLTAAVSIASGLPVYKASMMMVIAAFWLFFFSVFVYLSDRSGFVIGTVVTGLLLFVTREATAYAEWGGVPSILSMSMLIVVLHLLENHKSELKLLLTVIIVMAAFYVHPVPVIMFVWIYAPLLIHQGYGVYAGSRKMFLISAVVALTLFIPYGLTLQFPSEVSRLQAKEWQQMMLGYRAERWVDWFMIVPKYLIENWGKGFFIIFAAGCITALIRIRRNIFHGVALFLGVILLINTQYWVLPLSPMLYPDRAKTLMLLPAVAVISQGMHPVISVLSRYGAGRKASVLMIVVSAVVLMLLLFGSNAYTGFLSGSKNYSSVTPNDLEAIGWISENIPHGSVIANNYGDAGIWIPAVAGKTVRTNHSNPFDTEDLQKAMQHQAITHVFVGEKSVYGDHEYTSQLDRDPCYRRLFTRGGAIVYGVNRDSACSVDKGVQ